MFKVGQKVVCVTPFIGYLYSTNIKAKGPMPQVDCIYTVTGIIEMWPSLVLAEFPSEKAGFMAYKFRPLELDYDFVEEVIKKLQPEKQPA